MTLRDVWLQARRLWREWRDVRHLDGETLIVELRRLLYRKENV